MTRTNTTRLGALALSLLVVGFLVVAGSRAAFTATTDNDGNTLASGTVSITDDDATAVMFNASGLGGGDVVENCIQVHYTGDIDSDVRLYAENLVEDFGAHLTLDVEIGDTGGFTATATQDGDVPCVGWLPLTATSIYSGTLAGFTASDFGTGVGSWDTNIDGDFQTYRFVFTVADDNAAQGKSAAVDFVWEAQNQ